MLILYDKTFYGTNSVRLLPSLIFSNKAGAYPGEITSVKYLLHRPHARESKTRSLKVTKLFFVTEF